MSKDAYFDLDSYCKQISFLLEYPIVLVNIQKNDFFQTLASSGAEKNIIKKEDSFCRFVVEKIDVISLNFLDQSIYSENFYVKNGMKVYVGVPLWMDEKIIGTLCLIDTSNRTPTPKEIESLFLFSKEVSQKISLNRSNLSLLKYNSLLNEAQEIGKTSNWEWDFEIQKITWSDYSFKLFERDSKTFKLSYENYLSHLDEESIKKVEDIFIKIKNGEISNYQIEHWIKTGLGNKKYIKEIGYVERDLSGNIKRMYGTSQDITETKMLQETVAEQQQKLYYSNKLTFLSQMASSVSHEINNPLSVVIGYLELASEEKDLETLHFYLKKIGNSVERIREIVKQLSVFSKQQLSSEVSSNQSVVNQVVSFLKENAKRKNIKIELNFKDSMLKVNTKEMFQVYFNLIVNSIESLDSQSTNIDKKISIHSYENEHEYIIDFIDNGELISPLNREKLFIPFFTTKLNSNKLGLGLCLAKENSEKNHFKINYLIKDNKNCFQLIYKKNSILNNKEIS